MCQVFIFLVHGPRCELFMSLKVQIISARLSDKWNTNCFMLGTRALVYTIVQKRCCALGIRLLFCCCLVLSCPIKVSELGKKTCLWCRTDPVCLPQSFLLGFVTTGLCCCSAAWPGWPLCATDTHFTCSAAVSLDDIKIGLQYAGK